MFSGGFKPIIGELPKMTEENQNTEPPVEPTEDPLDQFGEIKTKYENVISEKDKEIAELKKQLELKEKKVDDTIQDLNDEVNLKLEQAEEIKRLQSDVNELLQDKAEALVDKYIQQGKLVPAQREKALNMCLSDQDMFISLYEDAPSIVDTNPKPKSHKVLGNVDKMVDYFKK